MQITPNTPINDLYHSEDAMNEDELAHWLKKGETKDDHKYIRREWKNGRWRYYYDTDSLKKDTRTAIKRAVDKTTNKAADTALKTANKAAKNLNTIVDKAKTVINKLYDDPNNMYDVNSSSYTTKMAKIKETKEWKDIVARQDPEYVKKNSDGTTSYLIDDYVVKKKHPVIDVISDIASGRNVDINEITKESTVAGLKEYAIGSIRTGMLAVGVVSTVLTEKFKLQQGSYDDEIKELTKTAERGAEYVTTTIEATSNVSKEDVEQMAKVVRKGQMVAESTRTINEGNVVKAARIIIESDEVRNAVGDNQYYKKVDDALSGLSEAEIEALNLLLKQMRQ